MKCQISDTVNGAHALSGPVVVVRARVCGAGQGEAGPTGSVTSQRPAHTHTWRLQGRCGGGGQGTAHRHSSTPPGMPWHQPRKNRAGRVCPAAAPVPPSSAAACGDGVPFPLPLSLSLCSVSVRGRHGLRCPWVAWISRCRGQCCGPLPALLSRVFPPSCNSCLFPYG